jgi:ribosomal protein S18 acetylase RimI-like enzyme
VCISTGGLGHGESERLLWLAMARLSNLIRPRDPGRDPPAPIECRRASRAEIEKGLRLILANASGPASDEAVLDFLSFAVHRKIDVNAMWVALQNERVVWALLPLISPGRTMLLLTPGRLFRQTPRQAIRLVAEGICREHAGKGGVVLAQLLVDPHDPSLRDLYLGAGFDSLAELVYLHRNLLHGPDAPELPAGFQLLEYSDATHARFAETIEQSYLGSLDCPALNGRRQVADVINGHKSAGIFDPSMWLLLSEGERDRGVLLLSPSVHAGTVELVYLGLVPDARGRGLGDLLMRVALAVVGRREFTELSLAVDANNRPALSLYFRHGMKRMASRYALVRDLEQDGAARAMQQAQNRDERAAPDAMAPDQP